jgi:hypothetical protein
LWVVRIPLGEGYISIRWRGDDRWEIPISLLVGADNYVVVHVVAGGKVASRVLKKLL